MPGSAPLEPWVGRRLLTHHILASRAPSLAGQDGTRATTGSLWERVDEITAGAKGQCLLRPAPAECPCFVGPIVGFRGIVMTNGQCKWHKGNITRLLSPP